MSPELFGTSALAFLIGVVLGRSQREREIYTLFKPKIAALTKIVSLRKSHQAVNKSSSGDQDDHLR